jgi:enoyl-[acyl-carrier protein] reductase II
MIWCSGWPLAAAAAEAGALGLIGAGSLYPDQLREHIRQAKAATAKPFGVNVPLLYPAIDQHLHIIAEEGVKVVFTSAGNPKTWTGWLKERGIIVVHVVSSSLFAQKAEAAGCDAVVCEGFEAGGHNGREETTTLVLVPLVRAAVKIPVIAAGGIASGAAWAACEALGADGVQVGSRFAATQESTGHLNFKSRIVDAREGDTRLMMKKLVPVRLLRNKFADEVAELEARGATADQLAEHLGRARAKMGMYEGNLDEGELEIGQVAAQIQDLPTAAQVVARMVQEYEATLQRMCC